MPTMTVRQIAFLTAILVTLAACGGRRDAEVSPTPLPATHGVGELLAAPTPGPVRAFGCLLITPQGAALVDGIRLSPKGEPIPLETEGMWLGAPPPLPAESSLEAAGDARYGVVIAAGALDGPGRFGPAGQYAFQLRNPEVTPVGLREVTIALLVQNSDLYEGQAVRVQGALLARPDAALLVERLGPGGVPEAAARQIKLARPVSDPPTLERLRRGAGAAVRFGPVQMTGVWRDGRLYPLAVQVLETR